MTSDKVIIVNMWRPKVWRVLVNGKRLPKDYKAYCDIPAELREAYDKHIASNRREADVNAS